MPADRSLPKVSLLAGALLVFASMSLALLHPPQAQASARHQALAFNKVLNNTPDTNQLVLDYRFVDHQGSEVALTFQVDPERFTAAPFHFRPLSTRRLQRLVEREVRRYADEQGWHAVQIQQQSNGLNISMRPTRTGLPPAADARVNVLHSVAEQATEDMLAAHYYTRLALHAQPPGYAPDHVTIAQQSSEALTPVAEALRPHLQSQGYEDPRGTLEFLLRWLQQIPYDELNDRQRSPGTGFLPPARVLHDNIGDCDSKVTLLATLFQLLHPNVTSAIVYLPGHAVFATELPLTDQDEWVAIDGEPWLVADPTGPAQLSAGEIAERYRSPLRSGAVTFKHF